MPILDVPGAGLVRFPDDMPREEIISFVETNILPRYRTEQPAPTPVPATGRQYFPLGAAVDTSQAGLYSALAGVGNITGIESLRQMGEAGAERNRREAEAALSPEQRMTFERAQTPEEYLRAGTQALTYSAPQTLATLGAATLGGMFGGPGGALAAGTAVNVPMFYGENRAQQEEAIRADPTRAGERVSELAALGMAVPQAMTETVIDRFTLGLGGILGIAPGFVARNLLPRIAAGIGVGSVAEVPAEVLQTAMSRAQAGQSLTSDEAMREFKEAAIGAAVVGGVTRGAAAAIRGEAPPPPPAPPRRGEDEELEKALNDLEVGRAASTEAPAPVTTPETPVEAGIQAATEATQEAVQPPTTAAPTIIPETERGPVTPPVTRPEATTEEAAVPPPPAGVEGFRTARGSVYTVEPNGTTVRNKAARSDVGHEGQFGIQPASERTIYVNNTDLPVLAPTNRGEGFDYGYRDNNDGTLSFLTHSPQRGWVVQGTVPYTTTHEVGVSPVEFWNGTQEGNGNLYSSVHFGNPITEVFGRSEAAPEAVPEVAPEAVPEAAPEVAPAPEPLPKGGQVISQYGADRFNAARAQVTGGEPAWSSMSDDQKRQVLDILRGTQFSGREVGAAEPQAAEPTENAKQNEARIEAARRVVGQRLEALRDMGGQGRLAATGLEEAMARNDLSATETYEAFRAADIMSKILPSGANHQIEFLKSFAGTEAAGKQGVRKAPKDALRGIIRLSLEPQNISVVRETAAHEAFHVLQDYYAKYDPKFAALLARDFKQGMTADELPASIKKKLSSSYVPGTQTTYFDFLKQNPYESDAPVSEIQAYVFGSLYDMNTRGVPITGIAPAYVRFINFVKSFFRGYAKDEGSLGALERVAAGDAARFAREATPPGPKESAEQAAAEPKEQFSSRQINTPEFKHWFDGSEVVDENNQPIVMYHGTSRDKDFDKFKVGPRGAWFTTNPKEASDYAEENDSGYRVVDYSPTGGFIKKDTSARVMPVYLSIKNPATLTTEQKKYLQFAKNYAKAQTEVFAVLRSQGYDGVNLGGGVWVALNSPTQIKSAIGNRGTFNPEDPRLQFSARRMNNLPPVGARVQPVTATNMNDEVFNLQYAAAQTWLAKGRVGKTFGEAKVNRFFEKFQDNMLPVAQAIDELRQYGYKVPVALDPYLKQDLMTGKIGTALKDRASNLYEPMFTKMRQVGVTQDEVETYLHARHAVERNAEMLRRNPDGGPAGSGMTDDDATKILAKFASQGKIQKLQSVAALVDKIVADTNNIRVSSGLTPDFAADPNGVKYQYYVPLKRLMEESPFADQGVGEIRARTGRGYGARGREDKLAKGSKREVTNILANVMLQNQEAVIRAEKNAVGNSYLSLIEDLNAKGIKHELGDILDKTPTRYIMQNGVVKEIPDFTYKNQPDIMVVKRGGEEVVIRIDDPRLARSMTGATGLSTDSISSFVKGLSMINQFLTRVNTSLNPEFVIVNFLRDIQTAGLALSQYDREKLSRQVISDVPKALAGIRKSVRGGGSDDFTKAFEEFAKLGGTTEYYGLRTLDQTLKSIDDFNATDQSKSSWRKLGDGVKKFGKFFEDYNNIVENGVRVAVFKNLRDSGVSPEKAAQVAKNLTTNFNRGGENRVLMNSLYLFYNASLQGSMALANGLVRSKKLRKIAGGIVVGGFMADMVNAMLSGEEDKEKIYDKIPDHVLEHNIILMDPFGFTQRGYFQIPMPYGFNSFYNTGRAIGRMSRGEYTPVEAGKSALLGMVEGFNPIGGTNSFYNFVAPTILDPLFDIARNENFAGQPIVPERGGAGVTPPQSQLYWSNTAYPYVAISQYLNEVTGGTPIIPGAIDISPNMIRYATNFALGAMLGFGERLGTTAFSTIPSAMRGDLEELEVRDVPFMRKFMGNVTTRNSMERYMQITEETQRIRREVNDAAQFGEVERINRVIEQYPNQYAISDDVQKLMRERTKLSREIRTIERLTDIPEQEKKQVLKALRDQQNLLVGEVIRLYNAVVRQR